jgi:hypothetical protein
MFFGCQIQIEINAKKNEFSIIKLSNCQQFKFNIYETFPCSNKAIEMYTI